MAIDFPNAPANGDIFTNGAKKWIYDSATSSWKVYGDSTMFLSTVTGGTVAGQVHINPSSSVIPLKITSFNNWGTTGVQFFNSTGDKQLDYWPDSSLQMTLPYTGVKFDITTAGSSQYADTVYRYRHGASGYTPAAVPAGYRLWEEYQYAYIAGTYKTATYYRSQLSDTASTSVPNFSFSLPNYYHTGVHAEAFFHMWGLKDSDWGLVQDSLVLDAGGSLFVNDPGGGYFPGWLKPKARFTVTGGESKWGTYTFTASIAGKVMTVTAAASGGSMQIKPGMRISVDDTSVIPDSVYILTNGTGTGGTGTYNLTTDCGTVTSRTINLIPRPSYGPRVRLYQTGTDNLAGQIEFFDGTQWASGYISNRYNSSNGTKLEFGIATTSTDGARTRMTLDKDRLTVTGGVTTAAGTTAQSSLRIPHGAAPTTPVDGDIWTTTAGLFVRINGTTVGPLT